MTTFGAVRRLAYDNGMASRAVRSTGFIVLKFGGQNALRLASNLILTRLLFPEAFGIMAIVQVVLGGAAMFSDLGIRSSIVQEERGNDPTFLNTAWTVQIARGIFLGLIIAACAKPVAQFYDTPLLADVLLVSAVGPLIQGFASTRLATASRELFIGRMVALHLGAQLASILAMIALAWWLQSVWALVIGSLLGPLLITGLSHVVLPGIRNRIAFDRESLKRLFGFGKYVFLATVASFFIGQGDKAVLGKFVTLADMSIYNIGFLLASVPLLLARALDKAVLFPLYARRRPADSESNRQKINQARFLLTGTLMAWLTGFALVGDELVRLLYDVRYHDAGPLMVLIAVSAMPQLITLSYASMLLAAGHSGRYAFVMITAASIQFGLMLLGAKSYGLVGVILAQPLGIVLFYPVLVTTVRRYQGWDARHDSLYFALSCCLAAAIVYYHQDIILPLVQQAFAG